MFRKGSWLGWEAFKGKKIQCCLGGTLIKLRKLRARSSQKVVLRWSNCLADINKSIDYLIVVRLFLFSSGLSPGAKLLQKESNYLYNIDALLILLENFIMLYFQYSNLTFLKLHNCFFKLKRLNKKKNKVHFDYKKPRCLWVKYKVITNIFMVLFIKVQFICKYIIFCLKVIFVHKWNKKLSQIGIICKDFRSVYFLFNKTFSYSSLFTICFRLFFVFFLVLRSSKFTRTFRLDTLSKCDVITIHVIYSLYNFKS